MGRLREYDPARGEHVLVEVADSSAAPRWAEQAHG